jgi:hypothetical protein
VVTQPPDPGALAAALLQLSEHASQLSEHASQLTDLDTRQSRHHADTAGRIAALTTLADAIKTSLHDQDGILTGLASQITVLSKRLDQITPPAGTDPDAYQPGPPPRFWRLDGQPRADAITRLRAWVEQVYRPGYGHLAAALGPCWDQHPLCLYTLDWLSELWSVLYLQPARTPATLAGQAEWQARLLTAAAEQMARETARCGHAMHRPARPAGIGTRP